MHLYEKAQVALDNNKDKVLDLGRKTKSVLPKYQRLASDILFYARDSKSKYIRLCQDFYANQYNCNRSTISRMFQKLVDTGYMQNIETEVGRGWDSIGMNTESKLYILNLDKLAELASGYRFQYVEAPLEDGKFIDIVNRYNKAHCNRIEFMTFDGGRCTSRFASLPTNTKEHKEIHTYFRETYLDEKWGEWEEYDVPSSIPQIFHVINKGFWLGKRVWDMVSSPKYKEYGMRLMFNKSPVKIATSILRKEYEDRDLFLPGTLSKDDDLVKIAGKMKQDLVSIVGDIDSIGKDIFIHESNIYLLVGEELMNRGIDYVQCYDGFYFKKGTMPVDIESIVKNKAEEYSRGVTPSLSPSSLLSNPTITNNSTNLIHTTT